MTADAITLLSRAVDAGELPGWVLGAGRGAQTELLSAGGWAQAGAAARPMGPQTLLDLASLTKVVATLPVVLSLVEEGALSLSTRAAEALPEFDGPGREAITVEQLLTHTSGLPASRPYGEQGLPAAEIRRRVVSEPLQRPPGECVVYSDLGFLVLGWLAEAICGRGLPALVADRVTTPLGMPRTTFGPMRDGADVAATEPRPGGEPCVGGVHDETAAALGGVGGHAGLFAPAADLGSYLAAWSEPSDRWLPAALRMAAMADRTAGRHGHRGLGWTARGDGHDQLGDAWPESAVFHSGFTGTSLALDPPTRRWVVLLTNDVHFGRGRGTINPLRRAVHTALAP